MRVLRFLFANWYARAYSWLSPPWPSGRAGALDRGARRGIPPTSDLMEGRDVLESRF
jgi:hypothetical protein